MAQRIHVFSREDFRKWLKKNHDKEKIVQLLIHKKHTGKSSPSHRELLEEGICFGWIDTIIKRIDEDTFIRTFQRRTEKSNWSVNTLSYAKQLVKDGKMTSHGLKFYHEGRKKKAFDHGIPKNPEVPEDLKKELQKNKSARENFDKFAPSYRGAYLRWIEYAKTPETRKKRIDSVVKRMSEGKKMPWETSKPLKAE